MDTIDLRIPPQAKYISVARLTAAAVAAHQAFSYDEIEDLKVAVSEACNLLIASSRGSGPPLALRFVEEDDALDIRIEGSGVKPRVLFSGPGAAGQDGEAGEDRRGLGVFLMQCLVDEVHGPDGDGGIALRLRKKQRENPDGNPSAAQ